MARSPSSSLARRRPYIGRAASGKDEDSHIGGRLVTRFGAIQNINSPGGKNLA